MSNPLADKDEAEKKEKEAKKEREKRKKEKEKKRKEREKRKKEAPPKKPKVEHITEPLKFTFEVAAEDLPRLPEAVVSGYRDGRRDFDAVDILGAYFLLRGCVTLTLAARGNQGWYSRTLLGINMHR